MACPIGPEELNKLKLFITLCSQKPDLLNLPQLEFFKNFIEQLGGKIPEGKPHFEPSPKKQQEDENPKPTAKPSTPEPPQEESEESDVEIDREGCVEPDIEEPQEMGDINKEITDEDIEQAADLRSQAAAAYSEQKYEEAIDFYTQAILLNPAQALFYAKRGQAFLKLVKPNACIRDCDKALELNCDSAAAYKFRGRAHRLLGNWETAAKDLRQACKIDYDDEADEWLREVTPNAKKLEQHRIKQERKKADKEIKARQERVRRAQEANKKAAEANKNTNDDGDGYTGGSNFDFDQADILSAFNDPEVAAALQDIMQNPENIIKYQSNPKVMNLIAKIGSSMGGAAGGAGGMPGFMGGMGGGFPGFGSAHGAGAGAEATGAGGFPGFGSPPSAPPSTGSNTAPPSTGSNTAPPKSDLNDDGLD